MATPAGIVSSRDEKTVLPHGKSTSAPHSPQSTLTCDISLEPSPTKVPFTIFASSPHNLDACPLLSPLTLSDLPCRSSDRRADRYHYSSISDLDSFV